MFKRASGRVALLLISLIALSAAGVYWYVRIGTRLSYAHVPLVLISVDTLRLDAVTGFGAEPGQTPAMEAFGNESVRFDTAIAATHFTSASHATMLTGFSPYVHATAITRNKTSAIPRTIPTLAEILQKEGYYTAGFTDAGQVIGPAGFNRGMDVFYADPRGLIDKSKRIEDFLSQCGEKPFFLFAHTYRAHQPYRAAKEDLHKILNGYRGMYKEAIPMAALAKPEDALSPDGNFEKLMGELSGKRAENEYDRKALHATYNSAVKCADLEVNTVLQMLKDRGVYDRAIIVITSDHGEAFFEHGVDSHKDVYDECVRVPLMIRFPGGKFAGMRIHETFPSVNLTPTLVELLQVRNRYEFEGRSVAAEIGSGSLKEEPAFVNWRMGSADRLPRGFAVRESGAKSIVKETIPQTVGDESALESLEVFNLERDPGELENLAGQKTGEEARLEEALEAARALWKSLRSRLLPNGPTMVEISADEAQNLRGIGYFK